MKLNTKTVMCPLHLFSLQFSENLALALRWSTDQQAGIKTVSLFKLIHKIQI